MTYYADLTHETMVAAGDHVRAIGWLHRDHAFTSGSVSAEFLARLKQFVAQSTLSADALFFGAFVGIHECEFCDGAIGLQNFGVPSGELLFVAPEMIVHYIEQHGYSPSIEFQEAVMNSPLPDSDDYQLICEPYWHLHRIAVDRMVDMNNHSELI